MVFGHMSAACLPLRMHKNAARNATSVLPYPTSPHKSLSMTLFEHMSALISSIEASWSGVSSYSNAASNSAIASSQGLNGKPRFSARSAYSFFRSNAIALSDALTRDLTFSNSAPPILDSDGVSSPM